MTIKSLIMTPLLLLSIDSNAQEAKAMVMKSTDDVEHNFVTNNILSIRYEGEQMIITHKNNETFSFNINEIKSITFTSVTTAIESTCGDAGTMPYSIFDISGTKILSGTTDCNGKINTQINLNGVYIIKVGDKTKNIIILKK